MPPKAKGPAATPLDKRLAASSGKEEMSHWNISELKQNLQEDSAVLEQTLREANKLLGDTAGVPIVDIKGQVSKDAQLKRLKELLPMEAAEIAADVEAAAASGVAGVGAGEAGPANVASGTFMTELDVSSSSSAPTLVGPVQTRMSEELALRLSVLEDAIGREAAQLLKLTIQSDLNQVCQLARKDEAAKSAKKGGGGGGGGSGGKSGRGVDVEEMEAQLLEEEALKLAAQEQVTMLKENLRMQSTRLAELQAKVALLDTSSQEGGELLRKREAETKGLRDELLAAQHKTRVEEGERHKLVDKLRKKEVEMAKSKESMDKMTMQLQRLGEERDKMHLILEDTRNKHAETQQRASALQAQLDKLQSAERVLKRNMQLQMPDETKKVVARIEHLEKVNKDLSEKLRLLKDTEGAELEKKRIKSELTDLRVHNKALTAKVEELRKDKDLTERAAEGQRRLLENRTRILLDKNTKSTQKLQGETELRIAERLHNRSADNEVASLRKRNLDVLTKLNVLEEQRMQEQQQLRDSQRRCSELSEKLELYATVHRIDMARLQFSPDVRAELAAEQKRLHSSSTLRLRRSAGASRASTATGPDGRTSAPPDLGGGASEGGVSSRRGAPRSGLGQARSHTPEVLTMTSRGSTRDGTAPPSATPSAARSVSSASATPPAAALPAVNGGPGDSVRGGGRAGGEASDAEALEAARQKIMLLQSKLNSEERGRMQAQDKCVAMAEQLLEKEAALQKAQADADNEKATGRRNKKKSERLRELEAQVMSQTTKMRETEMDKDQVEIKLNQKEEESRIKARKISDLIFKMSQVEESEGRLAEEVAELKGQLASKDALLKKAQRTLDELTHAVPAAAAVQACTPASDASPPRAKDKTMAGRNEEVPGEAAAADLPPPASHAPAAATGSSSPRVGDGSGETGQAARGESAEAGGTSPALAPAPAPPLAHAA